MWSLMCSSLCCISHNCPSWFQINTIIISSHFKLSNLKRNVTCKVHIFFNPQSLPLFVLHHSFCDILYMMQLRMFHVLPQVLLLVLQPLKREKSHQLLKLHIVWFTCPGNLVSKHCLSCLWIASGGKPQTSRCVDIVRRYSV